MTSMLYKNHPIYHPFTKATNVSALLFVCFTVEVTVDQNTGFWVTVTHC